MAMDIIPSQYCLVFFPLHLGHDDQLGFIKKEFLYYVLRCLAWFFHIPRLGGPDFE